MTAIAAIVRDGRVYMGGDSAAVEQNFYLDLAATPKVFQVGPAVIGYTSSFRMGHALQHRLIMPIGLPDGSDLNALDRWMAVEFMDAVRAVMREVGYLKRDGERESGGIFLCGVRAQIYACDEDFHARRQLTPYAACGGGMTACLGALYVSHERHWTADAVGIITSALAAAEQSVTCVRRPFNVVVGGDLPETS